MTFTRDLAWQNLDLSYRSSVAYQFARYALALKYELLPQEVIHQAKRCVLDALGCAIGGYIAPGRPICEGVIQDLGGPQEATVFCSGLQTSAVNATLVNAFLVRFLDYNDCGGGNHNSEALPALLAISEREKRGGGISLRRWSSPMSLGLESFTLFQEVPRAGVKRGRPQTVGAD